MMHLTEWLIFQMCRENNCPNGHHGIGFLIVTRSIIRSHSLVFVLDALYTLTHTLNLLLINDADGRYDTVMLSRVDLSAHALPEQCRGKKWKPFLEHIPYITMMCIYKIHCVVMWESNHMHVTFQITNKFWWASSYFAPSSGISGWYAIITYSPAGCEAVITYWNGINNCLWYAIYALRLQNNNEIHEWIFSHRCSLSFPSMCRAIVLLAIQLTDGNYWTSCITCMRSK